jgi:hypothetical protein
VTSYRPISLLPITAEVFERLLLIRTEEAVPLSKLIPPYQFGFRENHSTAQQCQRIINKIRESLETKKKCPSCCAAGLRQGVALRYIIQAKIKIARPPKPCPKMIYRRKILPSHN